MPEHAFAGFPGPTIADRLAHANDLLDSADAKATRYAQSVAAIQNDPDAGLLRKAFRRLVLMNTADDGAPDRIAGLDIYETTLFNLADQAVLEAGDAPAKRESLLKMGREVFATAPERYQGVLRHRILARGADGCGETYTAALSDMVGEPAQRAPVPAPAPAAA